MNQKAKRERERSDGGWKIAAVFREGTFDF
jgi:hypothetical protein